MARRWDDDERGHGVADARQLVTGARELVVAFDAPNWVAEDPELHLKPHVDAWRRFNRTIGADGTVGFWHETYKVGAGQHEAIYGNMPIFGLAAATEHVPAVGRRETARRRLGGENEPAVPSPVTANGSPTAR